VEKCTGGDTVLEFSGIEFVNDLAEVGPLLEHENIARRQIVHFDFMGDDEMEVATCGDGGHEVLKWGRAGWPFEGAVLGFEIFVGDFGSD
jgi:hypothetical protein